MFSYKVFVIPALAFAEIFSLVSQPKEIQAQNLVWKFEEKILDSDPLANHRINDIQIADIDQDGWEDIFVSGRNAASQPEHQAAWYKNPQNEESTWQRVQIIPGSWKYGALGDLDGDGDIDIATDNDDKWDGAVAWLENDGTPLDGGWKKNNLGLTGAPDLFYVEDLNKDGKAEIVVMYKDGPIYILRRPADVRAAWDRTTITPQTTPGAITAGGSVGDVDQDDDIDILFSNKWYENPGGTGWTDGGNWTSRSIDTAWATEARSEVGDVNGDGNPDIVLSGEETGQGVSWYENNDPHGTSGWTKHVITSVYSGVHSLQLADFNRDGRLDVFAAEMHTSPQKRVTVFEQTATGSWVEHVVSNVGSHNAKVADINQDSLPDIVGKNFEKRSGVDANPRLWLNRISDGEDGQLDSWKRVIIETDLAYNPVIVDVKDIDQDNRPDIITGGWWYGNPGSASGNWLAKKHTIGSGISNMAAVYDFDQDGDLDILGTNGQPVGGKLIWVENNGSGTFSTPRSAGSSRGDFLQGSEVAQLISGEGPEVILSWHNGARVSPVIGTEWLKVPSDATQQWALGQLIDTTNEEQVSVGDIDQDGDLDIHLGTSWLSNSSGTFSTQTGASLTGGDPDRVRLADIDGDSDLDVVITAEHADSSNPSHLVWAENNGSGGGWAVHEIPTSGSHELLSMDVGDIDQDGDIDISVGEYGGDGKVWIYENTNRGGSWGEYVVDSGSSTIDHHSGAQLHDVDADGDLDIVSIGWLDGKQSVVVYENTASD